MVGERTQAKYRLGDEVEVVLVRASVEERNLDFVLKDNGAYDPEAMKNALRGGRNTAKGKEKSSKNGKKNKKDKNNGKKETKRNDKRGGRKEKDKKKIAAEDIIAEAMVTDLEAEKPKKKSRGSRGKKRGASGEKLPKQENQQPKKKERKRQEKDNRSQEKVGERSRNREERRGGKEGDYHRVYVTGLNSAVWPDPPGYHERKMREEARQEKEKAKKAPKRRPRPHRKTEGGTANSK
jgi:ribonuclease R